MTSWSRSVYSTMVQEIAYAPETEEMIVTFSNGRVGAYAGVPENVALQVVNAPSVGQAINQMIKPMYAFRYV